MKDSKNIFTDDKEYYDHCHLYKTFPRLVSEDPSILTLVELLVADGYDMGVIANRLSSREDLTCSIVRATGDEPELTVSGFASLAETEDSFFEPGRDAFKRLKNELLENVRQFELACYVLDGAPKRREVNTRFDLYDLKDRLEAYIEKRTNLLAVDIWFGTLLAAALHCGFDDKRNHDGSLVYINLSDEAYDRLDIWHWGEWWQRRGRGASLSGA